MPKSNNTKETSASGSIKAVKIWHQGGSNPGDCTPGAWRERPLDSISDPDSLGITVSSNRIYFNSDLTITIKVHSIMFLSGNVQMRLFDQDDQVIATSSTTANAGYSCEMHMEWAGQVTSSTNFRLQYYCTNLRSNNGLGNIGGDPSATQNSAVMVDITAYL